MTQPEALYLAQVLENPHGPPLTMSEREEIAAELRRLHEKCNARQWRSLTDDEIKEIVGPWGDTPIKGYTRKLFDQIDAKLREKNV